MNKSPLFVISLDALGFSDEDIYKDLPFFSKMIREGSRIRKLESIYPTLTYPIHSTIVTGRYPIDHGVDNNLTLQADRINMDRYRDESYIKGDSIFRNAKDKGYRLASFSRPVTGGANIDYNVPEVWTYEEIDHNEHLKNKGSFEFIEELFETFGKFHREDGQSKRDEWMINAAAYTFNKYKPDITFIHLIDVDHMKHEVGGNHFATREAIKNLDKRVERLFDKISETTNLDDINIMLLSDHSQIDTAYPIKLNKILSDMNLVTVNEDGSVKDDWKAYFLTCGGSAALYVKDNDMELVCQIKRKIEEENIEGIDQIFNKEEIEALHASDRAVLRVEAKEGYQFEASGKGSILNKDELTKAKGNHGFLPAKEKNLAIAMFRGPAFKKGNIIEYEKMINIAPTVDKIYDLSMKDMSGIPIDCIK